MAKVNIKVPFQKKNEAKLYGVVFNFQTRFWEVDEERYDEIYRLLWETESEKSNNKETEKKTCEISSKKEGILDNSFNWETTFKANNPLYAVLMVEKHGWPSKEEDRINMLKLLGRKLPTDYPIKYEDMYEFSESFRIQYPFEMLEGLVQECFSGEKSYKESLASCQTISEEERALLNFALPL